VGPELRTFTATTDAPPQEVGEFCQPGSTTPITVYAQVGTEKASPGMEFGGPHNREAAPSWTPKEPHLFVRLLPLQTSELDHLFDGDQEVRLRIDAARAAATPPAAAMTPPGPDLRPEIVSYVALPPLRSFATNRLPGAPVQHG
jgi:hypothetical protein